MKCPNCYNSEPVLACTSCNKGIAVGIEHCGMPGMYVRCDNCSWQSVPHDPVLLREEIKKIFFESLDKASAINKIQEKTYWPHNFAAVFFNKHVKPKMDLPKEIRVGQVWKYRYASNKPEKIEIVNIESVVGSKQKHVHWNNGDSMDYNTMLDGASDSLVFVSETAPNAVTSQKMVEGGDVVILGGDAILGPSAPVVYMKVNDKVVGIVENKLTIQFIADALGKKATDVLLRALDFGMVEANTPPDQAPKKLNMSSVLTVAQADFIIQEINKDLVKANLQKVADEYAKSTDQFSYGDRWFHKTNKEYHVTGNTKHFSNITKENIQYHLSSNDGNPYDYMWVTEDKLLQEFVFVGPDLLNPKLLTTWVNQYGDEFYIIDRIVSFDTYNSVPKETVKLQRKTDPGYGYAGPMELKYTRQELLRNFVARPEGVVNVSGVPMDKQQTIKEVLKLLRPEDAIYGECVREHLTGEDSNQLNVFLFTKTDGRPDWRLKADLIQQLNKVFGKENVRVGSNKADGEILRQTVYIHQGQPGEPEASLKIDLETNPGNKIYATINADVNGLLMRSGKIEAIPGMGLDVERVKRHIKERIFRPKETDSDCQKLYDKGYTALARIGQKIRVIRNESLPYDHEEELLSQGREFTVLETSVEEGVCIDVGVGHGHNDHDNGQYRDNRGWWINAEDFELVEDEKEYKMKDNAATPGFVGMVKDDATDAAYRVAARTMTKGMRAAALQVLRGRLESKTSGKLNKREANKINLQVSAFEEFLDSEFGEAIISCALGFGLTYIPMIKDDPRAKTLAKEFRVAGMAQAGNAVVDVAMTEFVPVIMKTLQGLPEPKKVRIADKAVETLPEVPDLAEEAEEEAEVEVPVKRATHDHKR